MSSLKTALFDFHVSQGAKMVPFAGYEMPIQYSFGIINEHDKVRAAAAALTLSCSLIIPKEY